MKLIPAAAGTFGYRLCQEEVVALDGNLPLMLVMDGDLESPPIHGRFQQIKIREVNACATQSIYMQVESFT